MINSYGTTSDMIIQEIDDNGTSKLLAIDNKGLYLTTKDRVDRRLADVNRYGVSREETNELLRSMEMDPYTVFEENKHLIKTETVEKSKVKINPIKASKRRGG